MSDIVLQYLIVFGIIVIVVLLAIAFLVITSKKTLKSFRFMTKFASFEAEFETKIGEQ